MAAIFLSSVVVAASLHRKNNISQKFDGKINITTFVRFLHAVCIYDILRMVLA
jgi:hypothetical protein